MIEPTLPPWPARAALFLDIDGTLLEIAEEPEGAVPSPRLRALLPALAPVMRGAVALVSGRTIAELDRLLAPHRFAAAGVHGLERRDAAGVRHRAFVDETALGGVREALAAFAARHPGLILEDKRIGLALHYRKRPDLAAEVRSFVGDVERGLPPGLDVLPGRMVFEIKFAGMSKGSAIGVFMHEAPFAGRTPVFIGDDATDEAGFETVNDLGGVSVKVHTGPTVARWRLHGVAEVLAWLESVIERRREARGRA